MSAMRGADIPLVDPLTAAIERAYGDTGASLSPASTSQRSSNVLRPTRWPDVVGQEKACRLLKRVVNATMKRGAVLDHILLVGESGTGKSTLSHVIANEIGVDVYEIEAPISHDTLLQLRETMRPGDILRIEEIHQQAIMERRGKSAATQPEVLYGVMEDRVLQTASGVLPFPAITIIGTTTDEGMLPDAFVNRFPIRPRLEPYTEQDMLRIGYANAAALGALHLTKDACELFAKASRGIPRVMNNYVRNAAMLGEPHLPIDRALAEEVVFDLNGTTEDGLTGDMQAVLVYLFKHGRQVTADKQVVYRAGLASIAAGIGKSRDQRAVTLRCEPWLVRSGFMSVGHGGRRLTPAGIKRAKELLRARP